MAKQRVADIIVEALESAGVRHCYGVVGDTLSYVTDAIRRSQIEWVHVGHEETGAFAARRRLRGAQGPSYLWIHSRYAGIRRYTSVVHTLPKFHC